MEGRAKKAIATIGLCAALPIVWTVPGVTEYPLSVIGALLVGVVGISMIEVNDDTEIVPERNRARAVSCPSGV